MGLSTASVRHPHVMVMAPALTKASQSQSFKISPSSPTTTSTTSLHSRDEHNVYRSLEGDSCEKTGDLEFTDLKDAADNSNAISLVSEILKNNCNNYFTAGEENSENTLDPSGIMNSSPLHMGDQKDKMGLQKAGIDIVSSLMKDKAINNDVDQLFNNIEAVLPGTDMGSTGDIGQNVDELMQVIKSMETGSDRLGSSTSDLGTETDSIFPLAGTDLTSNLSSFEKELFNDVDVMNMSMEEQLLDGANTLKETHTKEAIIDLHKKQAKLERKLEFILRRLRKLQAKHMGQHTSEEISGIFEHVYRILRRSKDNGGTQSQQSEDNRNIVEELKPISQSSAKNLVKKLELSTTIQANAVGRQKHIARYFGSGSVDQNSSRSSLVGTSIPPWTHESKHELQRVVGHLYTETRLVQEELDSEATVSSSGGESCDELLTYNNPHQQFLTIQKRATWRYATERAAIASRWIWLQVQISELEHRIRQYTDLHKQMRANKTTVMLGGGASPPNIPTSPSAVNGYRGQLPGALSPILKPADATANGAVGSSDQQCARCRPIINLRKRKHYQLWGLHATCKKAARSSTIRCGCASLNFQCALCTGRTDPTRPRVISDHLSKSERICLIDPSFHPVFSLPEDASASIHLEAIMKTPEWQHRSTRPNIKSVKFISKGERLEKSMIPLDLQPKKQQPEQKRKYTRLIKSSTINALSAKIRSKLRGRKPGLKRKRYSEKTHLPHFSSAVESCNEEEDQMGNRSGSLKMESRSSSPLLSMQAIPSFKRNSRSSYDIDNIVIPYSVAASTRVEKLQYKEILTPKWRMVDPDFTTKYTVKNNGSFKDPGQDSDVEDFSEEAVLARHDKCEHDERKKFLSYLKFPYGYGRSRAHKRTDSRAESSGCNTPDPMSPHAGETIENTISPLTTPPATPLSVITEESTTLPSISVLRKRTVSQSRGKDKELVKEEIRCASPEHIEIIPYDRRVFPLADETYEKMLKVMPENHQFKRNIITQEYTSPISYLENRADSPDTESTESAIGDEDPNDPEWIDMENIKDRYRR